MQAALWCYAWDFAGNVDGFLDWAADLGFNQLNVAGTYHAGWFLHPARPRRAFMPEDGVCYFQPQLDLYSGTRLKPQVASVCAETDWFRLLGERAAAYNIRLVSWTIGTHNTRLGLLHPECCVTNCFGDPYPHALCPADPEVLEYLTATCRDLTQNLPLHAIQTESFNYMGWRHGHHHERDLTGLTAEEARLMNVCFHPATRSRAETAGIDAERLRRAVWELLNTAMNSAPDRPSGYPETWDEIRSHLPGLQPYLDTCKQTEIEVIQAVREAMSPTAELHVGGQNQAFAPFATTFSTGVYGQTTEQAQTTATAARAKVPSTHKLNVGVRLGMGVPANQAELEAILQAISSAGADGVVFYNASESPPAMLKWIKPALARLRA